MQNTAKLFRSNHKRGSPEEAETLGRGWWVVREAITKFLELKKFNEFDASRRLIYNQNMI